ncbi:MAG: type IV secretion system protein, partial [Novosphingobium sp.]
ARIALAVLLATGPIFVIMALFGPTRGLTAGWLRGVLLTAITPLFVTVGGSLMLELAVPVVAALRGMEGQVDPRAAMALFLIAAVHAALMTMMLKVAGTMAAAWSVFGLAADKDDDRRGGTSAATPMPPAEAMPVSPAVASSAAAARSRTAALIPASTAFEGAPAAAASSGGTSVQRTHIIQSGPDQNGLPSLPRNRARGVGSRFASPRTSLRKEMIR